MFRQALVRFGFRFADEAQEKLFVERFVLVHVRISQLFLMATWLLFCLFFLPLLCPLLYSNFRFNEILSFSFKKKKKSLQT